MTQVTVNPNNISLNSNRVGETIGADYRLKVAINDRKTHF